MRLLSDSKYMKSIQNCHRDMILFGGKKTGSSIYSFMDPLNVTICYRHFDIHWKPSHMMTKLLLILKLEWVRKKKKIPLFQGLLKMLGLIKGSEQHSQICCFPNYLMMLMEHFTFFLQGVMARYNSMAFLLQRLYWYISKSMPHQKLHKE